jgi:hypothetical protein
MSSPPSAAAAQRQDEGPKPPRAPPHTRHSRAFVTLLAAEELCDMMFTCELMADPVVASDGITYERDSIQLWMKTHDVSPHTNTPFDNKKLIPNIGYRNMIAAWCKENGVPVPVAPKRVAEATAAGGGAASAPSLEKPRVTCALHANEPLRVFCKDCCRFVCVLCAVDTDVCKSHATKAFKPLLEELKADREGWARAREECARSAEQLCAAIQADADAKKQAIDAEVVVLQQQVRCATTERCAALGKIVQKQTERERQVIGAARSPHTMVKNSASAAARVIASALDRAKAVIPPASAAEFQAAAAPAAAVGHVLVAEAVVDPEEPFAAMGGLSGSALLQRVRDGNKAQQFAALLKGRLPGMSYRLLYTWSRDGRSAASFHQRCDNQVCSRAFVRSAAARVTAGAGAHARYRALHHGPHVRRLRERAVEQRKRRDQRCWMLSVPGRKSSRRRPHLL